jgi:hypothetical protein
MIALLLDDSIAFAVAATMIIGALLSFLMRDPWVRRMPIWRWSGSRSRRHRARLARARHRRAA